MSKIQEGVTYYLTHAQTVNSSPESQYGLAWCEATWMLALWLIFISYHRGDEFRKEFSQIGELRSVLPKQVKIMAITATATKLCDAVVKTLGMETRLL